MNILKSIFAFAICSSLLACAAQGTSPTSSVGGDTNKAACARFSPDSPVSAAKWGYRAAQVCHMEEDELLRTVP